MLLWEMTACCQDDESLHPVPGSGLYLGPTVHTNLFASIMAAESAVRTSPPKPHYVYVCTIVENSRQDVAGIFRWSMLGHHEQYTTIPTTRTTAPPDARELCVSACVHRKRTGGTGDYVAKNSPHDTKL